MTDRVHVKLDEIRTLIQNARTMPMSSSCVVSRPELLAELDALRSSLDAALSDATEISAHRERFVSTGQAEAQTIMESARSEHDFLVSESAVFREGQRRAAEIIESAQGEAEALRRETDDYVDERLGTFEYTLRKTLEAVTRGRETLHRRSDLSELGHDPDQESPFSGPPPS